MAYRTARSTPEVLVSGLGVVATTTLGSVWTGLAVADGDVVATAARFLVAITAGLFYLVLFRVARRSASTAP